MRDMAIRRCAVIVGIVGIVALQGQIASADTKTDTTADTLSVGEANPVTVYVALKNNKPAFSQTENGLYHTGGIKWQYDKKKPIDLKITFKLLSGVKALKAKKGSKARLRLDAASNGEQTGTVEAKDVKDHFTVERTDGGSEDPKIVVTPR